MIFIKLIFGLFLALFSFGIILMMATAIATIFISSVNPIILAILLIAFSALTFLPIVYTIFDMLFYNDGDKNVQT